jgi:uncharacterized protein YvpB
MTYRTALARFRAAAGDFNAWTLDGVSLDASSALQLDLAQAQSRLDPPGVYQGRNFYNGGDYWVGEALSPALLADFPFQQAIPSWMASTPPGTWIEILLRAGADSRWTPWQNLGVWAADTGTIQRHSVAGQDGDSSVSTDTLVLKDAVGVAEAFQIKLRLFSARASAVPSVQHVALAYSTTPEKRREFASAGNPALWDRVLSVPQCSQMVYPNGGNVWCSATSVAMLLRYWRGEAGACEATVRHAVDGVYDWVYNGHGNWPFNTAYAAGQTALGLSLEAYVARFADLTDVEKWVAAGVPVAASLNWRAGDLTGAPCESSNGHLVVIAGFDAAGNPIVNDPAARSDAEVQRVYLRPEFESLWLSASGGAVYLVYPQGWVAPPF